MRKVVIFAGTGDGRALAKKCAAHGMDTHVCVATEYGKKVIKQEKPPLGGGAISVETGRMDETVMKEYLRRIEPELVIDATHPYAREVSGCIRQACAETGIGLERLVRDHDLSVYEGAQVHAVSDAQEAAVYVEAKSGNVFLTTGVKELEAFVQGVSDQSRLYARVLPARESMALCLGMGLEGKHLICMQGPFSYELNLAMFRDTKAAFVVTKESGSVGGFAEKVRAAADAGCELVVIRRPEEAGLGFEALCKKLFPEDEQTGSSDAWIKHEHWQDQSKDQSKRNLWLIGIGTGAENEMTLEARRRLEQVQVVFGAKRMLQAVDGFVPKEKRLPYYESGRICSYLTEHPRITSAAVVLSGDVGFYSGAAGLEQQFGTMADWELHRICGISSVAAFAARLHVPWQDVKLCSVHGRKGNLIAWIMQERKVMALLGDGREARTIAKQLLKKGMAQVKLAFGWELGYETEEIWQGTPEEFLAHPSRKGICVGYFCNPGARNFTSGNYQDEAFTRGAVPMTKEEIRAVALSKLRLTDEACCYDIGAGTGAMTMDIAACVRSGAVYAIEKNPAAAALIRENSLRLAGDQVRIIEGTAPKVLEALPAPTHAFIGGSSGNIRAIAKLLLQKNPAVRIVINTVTLETLGEVTAMLEQLPVRDKDIVMVTAARAKTAGHYHLLEGMNPVYIISFTGCGAGGDGQECEER